MKIATDEIMLANGELVNIGINMYAMRLMANYPGGLIKLQRDVEGLHTVDPDSEEYGVLIGKALHAMGYLLWALIRAGGTTCTQEQCEMAVSMDDFVTIYELFEKFTAAAQRMTAGKNMVGRVMAPMA